jgi:hypothetical protein
MTHSPITATTTANDDVQRVAHAVREACIRVALDGYEQGGLGGLCADGRFEMAIDSVRALDLDGIVRGCES